MLNALQNIAPLFLVIGLGAALRRGRFISAEGAGTLSRLVFRVAAPLLLLRSLGSQPLADTARPEVIVVIVGASLLTAAVTYVLVRGRSRKRVGVLAQGSFRSNTVFFGLPLVTQAYGDEAVARAAVVIGAMVITYNLLGAFVLALPRRRVSAGSADLWRGLLRDMALNPLVLGILGGILLSRSGLAMPGFLDRTLEMIGRTALPLALLAIGAGLDPKHLPAEWRPAFAISIVKLIVYPAGIWLALRALGLEGDALRIPVVLLSSPCAVMSYIMAKEMNSDEQLASAIVIGSTLLSVVTSVGWLVFLG